MQNISVCYCIIISKKTYLQSKLKSYNFMKRVLVVDDDKDLRASMEAILATEFLVSSAAGKDEALKELRGNNPPDIMLQKIQQFMDHAIA